MTNALSSRDKLKQMAVLLRVDPILEAKQISSDVSVVTDEEFAERYACKTIVALDNGQVLFSDISQGGLTRAKKVAMLLSKNTEIKKVSAVPSTDEAVKSLLLQFSEANKKDDVNSENKEEKEKTSAQQLLTSLIGSAATEGCSDIHILVDTRLGRCVIKFRLDGDAIVQDHSTLQWSADQALSVARLIINYQANDSGGQSNKSFDVSLPQDASCNVEHGNGKITIRYAHMDTVCGVDIIIRLFPGEEKVKKLSEQGYDDNECHLIEEAFSLPHGLIVFTGPTGAGKSTAMGGGLTVVPSNRRILTFEDPVEKNIPNASQVQVDPDDPERNWSARSKSAVRQDADVMVYGELRDIDVIEAGIRQASTGHLIISTLHANNSYTVPQRLNDMGVSFERLSDRSLLRAIIAQRLVKKLCQHCAIPLKDAIRMSLATESIQRIHAYFKSHIQTIKIANTNNGQCKHCNGRGEKGRLPIVEIIRPDHVGFEFIRRGDLSGWHDHLKRMGWKSMEDKAKDKIRSGLICPLTAEESLNSPFGTQENEFVYGESEALQKKKFGLSEREDELAGSLQ